MRTSIANAVLIAAAVWAGAGVLVRVGVFSRRPKAEESVSEWAQRIERENRTGHQFSSALLVRVGAAVADRYALGRAGEHRALLQWLDGGTPGRVISSRTYGTSPGVIGRALLPVGDGDLFLLGEARRNPKPIAAGCRGSRPMARCAGSRVWGRRGHRLADRLGDAGWRPDRDWRAGLFGLGGATCGRRAGAVAEGPARATAAGRTGCGRRGQAAPHRTDRGQHGGPGAGGGHGGRARWHIRLAARLHECGAHRSGGGGGATGGDVVLLGQRATEKEPKLWAARFDPGRRALAWQIEHGGAGELSAAIDVATRPSGELAIVGRVMTAGAERKLLALGIDPAGRISWERRWGGEADYATRIVAGADGGLVVAGSGQGRGRVNPGPALALECHRRAAR